MLLLVAQAGPLATAIERGLQDAGQEVHVTGAEEGLFDEALGKKAIVYIPFARALEGFLSPAPKAQRTRAVLGAAKAPGVEVVVFVLPPGEGYAEEVEALRRDGKPYVIVRTPPLLEEIAERICSEGVRSIWAPREGKVRVAREQALTKAVLAALETEDQGTDLSVEASEVDGAELFAQAAELLGDVRVHAVRPSLFRVLRPIARWLRRGEPAALGLWDGLAASSTD